MRFQRVRLLTFLSAIAAMSGCKSEIGGGSEGTGGSPEYSSGGGRAQTGGVSSAGAASSGGEAGSSDSAGGSFPSSAIGGMGGEGSGGASVLPCNGECKGDRPTCDESNERCVGCLTHADCVDPTKPMCNLEQQCVPCTDDFSCKDTLMASGRPVCLDGATDPVSGEVRPKTGECVECATSSDCGGDVCDPIALRCLPGAEYRQKWRCDSCEHDLNCDEGLLCVEEQARSTASGLLMPIGKRCMWTKAAVVGSRNSCAAVGENQNTKYPFVAEATLTSIGGVTTEFCVLATTTCAAYKTFGQFIDGCDQERALANPTAADAVCGAPGVDDAICRKVVPDGTGSSYQCTYRCESDVDCLWFSSCLENGGERHCDLN